MRPEDLKRLVPHAQLTNTGNDDDKYPEKLDRRHYYLKLAKVIC